MNWHAITTCNDAMWEAYGRAMVNTFERHWPAEAALTVYTEGFAGDRNGRVQFVDLDQSAPWLAPWKAVRTDAQRGMSKDGYRFRWDAVKFSHKVAAIGAAADRLAVEINLADGLTETKNVLIWLDADIVTHAPVTHAWLESLFPSSADVAWLDRERWYPECGVLFFRLPAVTPVIRQIVTAYQTGEIFRLQQWHDSYVIETVVKAAEAMGQIKVASLSGKEGCKSHHPLVNSRVAEALDHLKGNRKIRGRSKPDDLIRPRPEPYWQ